LILRIKEQETQLILHKHDDNDDDGDDEMRLHVTYRHPELVEICTLVQVKFYCMQTVYRYNIGCVAGV
jgi:hypothetical protein